MASIVKHNDILVSGGYFITCGQNGFLSYASTSTPTAWATRSLQVSETLNSIATDGANIVAVGTGGIILRSSTASPLSVFTPQTSPTNQTLNHVRYGNGQFVAVGVNGTILTSPTGVTWTVRTSGTTLELTRCRYIDSWYAVGRTGALIRGGTAGTTWVGGSSDARAAMGIAYNNGVYSTMYRTSTDGVNWTSHYNNILDGNGNPYSPTLDKRFYENIVWSRSTAGAAFCAVGNFRYSSSGSDGSRALHKSTDGITYQLTAANGTGTVFTSFLANNNLWTYGEGGSAGASYDGQWTGNDATTAWNYTSYTHFTGYVTGSWQPYFVTYVNGFYVALGTVRSTNTPTQLNTAVYRGTSLSNMAYVLRYNATNILGWPCAFYYHTTDGVTYQMQHGIASGNGIIMAVGPRLQNDTGICPFFHYVFSADNGSTWTFRLVGASNPPASNTYDCGGRVAFGNGVFVMSLRWAVNGTTPTGRVAVTTDGASLAYYSTGYTSRVREIQFLNGYFYALHDNGGISRSTNGTSWTTLITPATWTGEDINDIGKHIGTTLLGGNVVKQTATDGVTFTTNPNEPIGIRGGIFLDGTSISDTNGRLLFTAATAGAGVRMYSFSASTGVYTDLTGPVNFTAKEIAKSGSTYIAATDELWYSTNAAVTWTKIPPIEAPPSGVGIIIKDENGLERIQSYDVTKQNYLCTRLVRTDYVTAAGTQINVPEANGYKIFTFAIPEVTTNGQFVYPYPEYHRGTAPNYTPYFIVRYPSYGGYYTGTQAPATFYTFTTGVVEQTTY